MKKSEKEPNQKVKNLKVYPAATVILASTFAFVVGFGLHATIDDKIEEYHEKQAQMQEASAEILSSSLPLDSIEYKIVNGEVQAVEKQNGEKEILDQTDSYLTILKSHLKSSVSELNDNNIKVDDITISYQDEEKYVGKSPYSNIWGESWTIEYLINGERNYIFLKKDDDLIKIVKEIEDLQKEIVTNDEIISRPEEKVTYLTGDSSEIDKIEKEFGKIRGDIDKLVVTTKFNSFLYNDGSISDVKVLITEEASTDVLESSAKVKTLS